MSDYLDVNVEPREDLAESGQDCLVEVVSINGERFSSPTLPFVLDNLNQDFTIEAQCSCKFPMTITTDNCGF